MKILNEQPPVSDIWKRAHELFEIDDSGTVYAWGDTIYNPAGIHLPDEIVIHESVHSRQQHAMGGPSMWWEKYLTDATFRAAQEAEAYYAQYRAYCSTHKDRNQRARYLHEISSIFSSPMYKLGMTRAEAAMRIVTGI